MAETALARIQLEVEVGGRYRVLAEVVGPEDGTLLIHHAGTPGTRHLHEDYLRAAAERGLRHACYSRPGYEGSGRRPGRIVADCAEEGAAVADALGAPCFHVLGLSGGGPPALACAALLPERVLSVTTFGCVAPRNAAGLEWLAGMADLNLSEYSSLEEGDEALLASIESLAVDMLDDPESIGDALEEGFCERDRVALTGSYLEYQRRGIRSVLAAGLWGWFDDDKSSFSDWGFDLTEISVPALLWHGSEDRFVPPAHSDWLAGRIPGAELHRLHGHGHVSLFAELYPAALDELIAAAR